MRIIDTNKDYYDYYQNIYLDDTFVFDRRDSYNLTKKEFAGNFYNNKFSYKYRHNDCDKHFVLLQVCHSFWLFYLNITEEDMCGKCTDYSLDLIANWKDYNKKRELIKLSKIEFYPATIRYNNANKYIEAIKTNDIRDERVYNEFRIYKGFNEWETRHIPILKNIGIASIVDAFDIYTSIEEFFSEEKTSSERTEAIGTTNNDKITYHGFDLKTSFRGK